VGGSEFTLAQKVLLLELNKVGLPRGGGVYRELMDAQIVELGLVGAVRIENRRVCAVPTTAWICPELRPAYEVLLQAPSWPLQSTFRLRKLPSVNLVAEQLIERGVLCRARRRRLGVLPIGVWGTVDPRPRQELEEHLRAILLRAADRSPLDVALLLVLSDPSVARLFSGKEWVETAKGLRIGIVAGACPEGSFLRDFVKAKRPRWSDERTGLIEDLWDRFK